MSSRGERSEFVDALIEEARRRRRDLLASCRDDLEAGEADPSPGGRSSRARG